MSLDFGPILPEISPVALVLRPLVIYVAVLAFLRLAGKRQIGELTPGDLVVLLLLSETLQGALVAGNNSLLGGLIAAATLLSANRAVAALAARSWPVERILEGEPTILIYRGRYLEERMREVPVSRAELDRQLREQGVFDIGSVDLAILEADGQLSVRRREEAGEPVESDPPDEALLT